MGSEHDDSRDLTRRHGQEGADARERITHSARAAMGSGALARPHAFLVAQILAHLDDLDEAIDTVSTQIDTLHCAQRNPMCRCPTAGLREKPARNVTLSRSGAESKT